MRGTFGVSLCQILAFLVAQTLGKKSHYEYLKSPSSLSSFVHTSFQSDTIEFLPPLNTSVLLANFDYDPEAVTEISDQELRRLGFPIATEMTNTHGVPSHSSSSGGAGNLGYPNSVLESPFIHFTSHPPVISEVPQRQRVRAGGIAALQCMATGDPTPHITWRKNGNKIPSTVLRYSILEFTGGSVLRIEPIRKKETQFECVAENGVGDPVSASIELEIFDDKSLPPGFPRIIQSPAMKVEEKGRNALLVCQATGNPQPNIYWVKDGMRLNPNPRYIITEQGSLQIKDSQETDQGKYECVAENAVGTEYSYSAQLYVRVRRVPPQFTIPPESEYEVMVGSGINLTCVANGSPMPHVKWRRGSQDVTPGMAPPIGMNVLQLHNIQETENYTCVAASKLGIIEATTIVRVQALPRPPSKVKISEVTPTSVRLSWSYPGSPTEVQYYVIQYKPKLASWDYKEISGAITTFYDIRGLTPYTEYEFVVLAVNNVGRGDKSMPVVTTTGETGTV